MDLAELALSFRERAAESRNIVGRANGRYGWQDAVWMRFWHNGSFEVEVITRNYQAKQTHDDQGVQIASEGSHVTEAATIGWVKRIGGKSPVYNNKEAEDQIKGLLLEMKEAELKI